MWPLESEASDEAYEDNAEGVEGRLYLCWKRHFKPGDGTTKVIQKEDTLEKDLFRNFVKLMAVHL